MVVVVVVRGTSGRGAILDLRERSHSGPQGEERSPSVLPQNGATYRVELLLYDTEATIDVMLKKHFHQQVEYGGLEDSVVSSPVSLYIEYNSSSM